MYAIVKDAAITATGTIKQLFPNTSFAGGVANEEFRVGVGGSVEEGKLVRLVEDGFTTPSFFRIYDFGPSLDIDTDLSRLTFKWNYDNLDVSVSYIAHLPQLSSQIIPFVSPLNADELSELFHVNPLLYCDEVYIVSVVKLCVSV